MNKRVLYFVGLAISIIQCSCNKFFDVKPSSTSVNPTTVQDFEEMLNSDSLATCNFFLMDLMSDDVNVSPTIIDTKDVYYKNAYYWSDNIWNAGDVDQAYNRAYTRILQMNIILDRLDGAKLEDSTTVGDKERIRAQALINRAWYYLQLVNCYGNAFDSTTSNSDLGVPLVLKPDATADPARATVSTIYNQILSDLTTATKISTLPAMGSDIIHPGMLSAYGLLARTYLYMGNYDSAFFYSDAVISSKDTLMPYSSYTKPTQLLDLKSNPEILLARICTETGFYSAYLNTISMSTALGTVYGTTDYRRSKRFTGTAYTLANVSNLVFDYSLKTAEMYLIKAECLARKGNNAEAITLLNLLRRKRMSTYTALDVTSTNALQFVMNERRKELLYMGGLRMFDLKRLNKEAAFKTDISRYTTTSTVITTLPAGSPRYLMQFSPIIIGNNPNIVQNPR